MLKIFKTNLLLLTPVLFATTAYAVDPLAARTMIVYVSNSTDSVMVKDYYAAARSVTATCPITLPDITATALSLTDYVTFVRNPVRNCLNSIVGPKTLYIVLAYLRPYKVQGPRYVYALDSYLADIWDQYTVQNFYPVPTATHRYYAPNQSQGDFYLPFQSFATFRDAPRSALIYSVWRLDGANPAIANGLVDKATGAMNNLSGGVCLDRRNGFPVNQLHDSSYGMGDWDISRAGTFFGQAGFSLTEDQDPAEFGTSPAPAKCPADGSPVAFYSGWYSLNNYNGTGVFNFAPGAIGIHLDSGAAVDPRGGTNWSANALLDGITVTAGAVYEPYLEGIPRPGGIARNLLEGANIGDAFLRNTRWLKWEILNIGDPLYRPFPATGLPSFNPAPPASFYLSSQEVVGGATVTGTVNLASPAPSGGLTISLATELPVILNVPSTVTVPAGAKTVSFPIVSSSVSALDFRFITATFGAVTLQNSLALDPLLGGLGLSASSVTAGHSLTGGVFLNASAPAGGALINLTSSDTSAATVPLTVLVPAGLGRVNFPITTFAGSAGKTVKIQASYAGATPEATFTIN